MKRHRPLLVVAALLGVSVAFCVHAQEMAPPIAVEPERLEATAPPAPAQMRAEDAAAFLQQMRGSVEAPAPRIVPEAAPPPPDTGGVSRTISVQPPEVVNKSTQFLFRDVTDRTESVPKLSLAERQAAVEAYRQSRVTKRGTGR